MLTPPPPLHPWTSTSLGTTQHNTTQHNTTQHNTTQHNTTRHDTTQHDTTQHNTTQHNTTQHNTTQHNTTRHNTTQHNTTQHNTTQHNTTQHNTTQHNTRWRSHPRLPSCLSLSRGPRGPGNDAEHPHLIAGHVRLRGPARVPAPGRPQPPAGAPPDPHRVRRRQRPRLLQPQRTAAGPTGDAELPRVTA